MPQGSDLTMSGSVKSEFERMYPNLWVDSEQRKDTSEQRVAAALGHVQALEELIQNDDASLIPSSYRDKWLEEIEQIRRRAKLPQTVIGFYGESGAGKSSLINAVLKKNIVPTAGMGSACTAAAIEIEYHEHAAIQAQIQFTSLGEWTDKVTRALGDVSDAHAHGVYVDDVVLMQEIKAVYPSFDEDALSALRVGNFAKAAHHIIGKYPDIQELLGSKKLIACGNDEEFLSLLSEYTSATTKRGPAYWPLLSSVRVQCRADALRTGAVLVDLPGVKDKNAARKQIATDYMKRCEYIFIVAPIVRAVDNETTTHLLDESVRVQLQMDSLYNADQIALVATHSDSHVAPRDVIPHMHQDDLGRLQELDRIIKDCRVKIALNTPASIEWKYKKLMAEKKKDRLCCTSRNEFAKRELARTLRASMNPQERTNGMDIDGASANPYRAFAVSARDYQILNELVEGETQCFDEVQDTGIPELQNWCITATARSRRSHAAKELLESVKTFAAVVEADITDADSVTPTERQNLRHVWRSEIQSEMERVVRGKFKEVIKVQLQIFKKDLSPKLEAGIAAATRSAIAVVDDYAGKPRSSAAFRASLRRHGEYHRDLNQELVFPMVRDIAADWANAFALEALAVLEKAIVDNTIEVYLGRLVKAAPPALEKRVHHHAHSCILEARLVIRDSVTKVRDIVQDGQKTISRSVAPFIKSELDEVYEEAISQKGAGSFQRQKVILRDYLEDSGEGLFSRCKTSIQTARGGLRDVVKKALLPEIDILLRKVNNNLKSVWEPRDIPQQSAACKALKNQLEITQMWANDVCKDDELEDVKMN